MQIALSEQLLLDPGTDTTSEENAMRNNDAAAVAVLLRDVVAVHVERQRKSTVPQPFRHPHEVGKPYGSMPTAYPTTPDMRSH